MLLPSHRPTTFAQQRILLLIICCLLSIAGPACAKRSRSISIPARDQHTAQTQTTTLININTASAKELETLPGIGESLAQRIIEHRQKYGPFRRAEHLMMVRGISDHRFRALRDSITVESGSLR